MLYVVVEQYSSDELVDEVNKLIAEGWEPLGGVSITLSEDAEDRFFKAAQALIKRAT